MKYNHFVGRLIGELADLERMESGKIAANSNTTELYGLSSLFECPVCFGYALPPILQCQHGHLVCYDCRPRLECCPTCRSPFGAGAGISIRNLAMEKVASSVIFPCKYFKSGCQLKLLLSSMLDHENNCDFRPFLCPSKAVCKWVGLLQEVVPHVTVQHKYIKIWKNKTASYTIADINKPVLWKFIQSVYGHHFLITGQKQEKCKGHPQLFITVQIIGSREQAKIFSYSIALQGGRRKLTYEGTPCSLREGIDEATTDCLVLDIYNSKLFDTKILKITNEIFAV